MRATIALILLTAFRDRLFGALFALLAVSTALAIFLGGTLLAEQLQSALVFAAGAGRFILILGLAIFAAAHIQGLFETREIEAILSRAISRPSFVVAYWAGFACLAALVAGFYGAIVTAMAALTTGQALGALVWTLSLIAECVIVLSVTLFAGLMMERVTPTALFTFGFYVLARLMGYFVGIRDTATNETVIPYAKRTFDAVLLFIPRLDLFAQTRWVIYGFERSDLAFVGFETALFLMLVLGAATFDLVRKEF